MNRKKSWISYFTEIRENSKSPVFTPYTLEKPLYETFVTFWNLGPEGHREAPANIKLF